MKLQKARKEHVCDDCGEKIEKGSMYWRSYQDEPYVNEKTHTNCEEYKQVITATAVPENSE